MLEFPVSGPFRDPSGSRPRLVLVLVLDRTQSLGHLESDLSLLIEVIRFRSGYCDVVSQALSKEPPRQARGIHHNVVPYEVPQHDRFWAQLSGKRTDCPCGIVSCWPTTRP